LDVSIFRPDHHVQCLPIILIDPNLRELEPENESGQEIIDALQLIVSLAPQLDASLHHRFESLVDNVVRILGSRFAVIRHMAARALAVLCDVLGSIALQKFMNQVLPFLGDANDALNRQGAIEAVSGKHL
jgi:TATA-binding protein-associated factor